MSSSARAGLLRYFKMFLQWKMTFFCIFYEVNLTGGQVTSMGLAQKWQIFLVRLTWKQNLLKLHCKTAKHQLPSSGPASRPALTHTREFFFACDNLINLPFLLPDTSIADFEPHVWSSLSFVRDACRGKPKSSHPEVSSWEVLGRIELSLYFS